MRLDSVKQVASGTRLESVGTVKTVVGTVKAVDASGAERVLQAGDKVHANETIVTAEGGMVLVELANGTHFDLPAGASIVLGPELTGAVPAQAAEDDVARLQELIAAGEDPSAELEATAAGAVAGDEGGSSFVVVDFNNAQGAVNSGIDTTGIPAPQGVFFTELPPAEEEVAEVPSEPPVVIVGSLLEVGVEAGAQGVQEGAAVVYTVTLDRASSGDVTVTLSNGVQITIPAGQLSGSSGPVPVQGDDPYVDPSYESVQIESMTGGGANEELQFNPAPVGIDVNDTIDITAITLHDVTVDEGSGTATLTASVGAPVTGSDLVITLSNGASITIEVGQSSGVSTPFAVQGDDVYLDGAATPVSITGTSGGNYEALDSSDSAVVTVDDTTDITAITLHDVTVDEGSGTATLTASVGAPVTGSDLVITLSNGASITIEVGQSSGVSTPFAVQGDDVYLDGAATPVSITGTSGGNYEALDSSDSATVTVEDTTTPVTVSLTASSVLEGASATYTFTATLSAASQGVTTVVTDRGTITIGDGQTSGTLVLGSNGEDVYLDASSLSATIQSASGGNFEQIDIGSATAKATIGDTLNTTNVTLGDVTVTESGSFVYTATVDHAPQGSDLVITLDNTVTITIPVGQLSGSSLSQTAPNVPDGGTVSVIGIASAAGGNYEVLDTADTLTLTVNDTAPTPAPDSYSVTEGQTLTVDAASGVLANDVDGYDGGKIAVAGTLTGSLGGSLALESDGSFSYVAPVRNHADSVADSETFTYTMRDADGTERTATITIGIGDTEPVITATTNGVLDNQANLQLSGTIAANGVDGIHHFDLSGSVAPAGLSYSFSEDGSQLTATDDTGETVFTLSVNPDGSYQYTLLKPVAEAVAVTPDFDTLNIPNHATSYTLTLYGAYDSNGVGIGSPLGTVTFETFSSWLSASQDGLGIQNNLMNTGEQLWMNFDSAVSNATFAVGNFKISDALVWKVYDADGNVLDSGTISGSFYDADGKLVNVANNESANYSIDLSQNGLDAGLQFHSITIESSGSSNSFKFTGFSVEKALTVADQTYDFEVVAVDGDGDASVPATFSVTVDGTGSTLNGTDGSDILVGGKGDDILVGGLGADTFVWGEDDLAGTLNGDTITGFSVAQGDTLDVDDLLASSGGSLGLVDDGSNTTVTITTGSGTVNLVTLTGVTGETLNTLLGDA